MKPQISTPQDAKLDQQIIAAYFATDGEPLRDLSGSGLSAQALNERGSQLGLTREFIKRCRLAGTRPAMRSCVKCDSAFLSAGTHNRLCGRCPAR